MLKNGSFSNKKQILKLKNVNYIFLSAINFKITEIFTNNLKNHPLVKFSPKIPQNFPDKF